MQQCCIKEDYVYLYEAFEHGASLVDAPPNTNNSSKSRVVMQNWGYQKTLKQ